MKINPLFKKYQLATGGDLNTLRLHARNSSPEGLCCTLLNLTITKQRLACILLFQNYSIFLLLSFIFNIDQMNKKTNFNLKLENFIVINNENILFSSLSKNNYNEFQT